MVFTNRIACTITIGILLFILQKINKNRKKRPKIPIRTALLGFLTWSVSAAPDIERNLNNQANLAEAAGNIGFFFATSVLIAWAILDLPNAQGWWKSPPKIITDFFLIAIGAIFSIYTLQDEGINLSGLITASAFLGAAIGFGAQEPLKDIFGGLGLQLDQPFKEGDWIEVNNHRGRVIELTLMNTYLRNGIDGAITIIPNNIISQSSVRKIQPQKPYGNCFEIGLSYDFAPSQAKELIRGVILKHSEVLTDPCPQVWVAEFAESSIKYGIRVWHIEQNGMKRKQVRGQLLERIWYSLERANERIPYPVRTVLRKTQINESQQYAYTNKEQNKTLLKRNEVFGKLNEEEIEELSRHAKCVRFANGETIISQGEEGKSCYIVIEGRVSVTRVDDEGNNYNLASLKENDLFGEMALCTDAPRSATVKAKRETLLLEIKQTHIKPLIEKELDFLVSLAEAIHHRKDQIESMASKKVRERPKTESQLIRSMKKLYNIVNN